MNYYIYKIDENADAKIISKFPSFNMAAMSADLLLIKDVCFILSEDMSKIYFYSKKDGWDYDVMTKEGQAEFLDIYQNPKDYKDGENND